MEKKTLKKRLNAMREEQTTWRSGWQDIQKYIAPHRGMFDALPNQGGVLDHKTLLDSTATRASNTLAAGMTSGLTSPAHPWFKLGLDDSDLEKFNPVKIWLEDTASELLRMFARAKIYNNFTSVYEEVGDFSVGAMGIFPDRESVFRGQHFTCGEYYISHDAAGRLNGFGREFYKTVEQLAEEFGEDNLSHDTRELYKKGELSKWIAVNHITCANADHIEGAVDKKRLRYIDAYWESKGADDEKFLRVGGYNVFPFMAPRWGQPCGSNTYSKSAPGYQVLGDVKMAQKLSADYLRAVELVNKPPMQRDGNIKGNINILPGGVTTSDSMAPNAGLRPAYQINPNLQAMSAKIQDVQQAIRSGYFVDLFLMLASQNGPQKTAKEVAVRYEEKLLVLGPLLESLEGELLDPAINRAFDIALNAGVLPPIPQELMGRELRVEYISPLAQAQKMVDITAIETGVAFIGNLAAVKPDILDIVDLDEAGRQHLTMDGVSARIIRTPEAVQEIRTGRAQAQQQAQAAQTALTMVQGAKVLSDTKTGQNSALDQVLAAVQGGPAK